MKGKENGIIGKYSRFLFLFLLLCLGLLVSSCKEQTPVGELPVGQEGNKETGGTGTNGQEGQEQQETVWTGEVTLYLPNDTADGFLTSSMILEDTPEAIIRQLIKEQALPEGIKVLRFDREEGILDLSEEFARALQNSGTTGELQYIGCVVNTFLEHYEMDAIMLYSSGQVIETGHNTYDEPVGFVEWE